MAQDQPTKLPEWASSPPTPPPTTITEPSEPTKQAGWQPGFLRRQYLNWWMNLVYQWIVWLSSLVLRVFNVFFADQAFPGSGGDLPSTGAGLGPISAADFSARVVADGFLIGPVDGPAYTYSASKDTYWDLGRDGTWTASVVNNGAGAPALASHSTRCFKVVTNGSARTSVTDYRLTYPRIDTVFDFGQIRLGEYLIGTLVNAALPRLFSKFKSDTVGYTLLWSFSKGPGGDTHSAGLYFRHSARELVYVNGAYYDAATDKWTCDTSTLGDVVTMETIGAWQKRCYARNSTAAFDDADWYADQVAGGDLVKQQDFVNTIRAGMDLGGSDYERSELFRFIAKVYGSHQREAVFDAGQLKIYALPDTQGTDSNGKGGEHVANAVWNSDDQQWNKIDTGSWSAKLAVTQLGVTLHGHKTGDAWDDDTNPGNWILLLEVDSSGNIYAPGPTLNMPASSNILHAGGHLLTNGSAGFSVADHFGVSSLTFSSDQVRIHLSQAMTKMYPVATLTNLSKGMINISRVTSSELSVSIFDENGTPYDLSAVALEFSFHVGGYI